LLAAAILSAAAVCPAGGERIERPADIVTQSPAQLEAGIERKHPIAHLLLAKALFLEGRRDEAVFWFYLGQPRGTLLVVGILPMISACLFDASRARISSLPPLLWRGGLGWGVGRQARSNK
jgi:hypothetical protein